LVRSVIARLPARGDRWKLESLLALLAAFPESLVPQFVLSADLQSMVLAVLLSLG
jgi:hypothetical protein